MPAGTYTTLVSLVGKGYLGLFASTVPCQVLSISPLDGSQGGEDIVINGSGFDKNLYPSVTVGGKNCYITSVTPKSINCRASSIVSTSG